VRPEAEGTAAGDALARRDIRVLRPGVDAADPLRVRFTALSIETKAARFRLDSLNERAEYNSFLRIDDQLALESERGILEQLQSSSDPVLHALAERIENLGILDWALWTRDRQAATEIVETRPDATVLDLGGFPHSDEPLVVARFASSSSGSQRRGANMDCGSCSPRNDHPRRPRGSSRSATTSRS